MIQRRLEKIRNVTARRRTKIVATVGPSSNSPDALRRLMEAGVNIFRQNFSHGTHESHQTLYNNIRTVAQENDFQVAILADLCGPKIRCGSFENGGITLVNGERVTVTTRDVQGRPGLIPSLYEALARDVNPGDSILLSDGVLALQVVATDGVDVVCTVIQGGQLTDRKGINLPGVQISTPSVTPKDRADARFAAQLGVDFMALSFVRCAADVGELKSLLHQMGKNIPVISKIEKPEAIENIDEILDISEGVMVARGDLGVEMAAEEVPLIQRELTRMAIEKNRLVIVATQMLESMIHNARPTRAEVTDVAWACMAGTDAVMLSGETAVGSYPICAVETMVNVLTRVESAQLHDDQFAHLVEHTTTASDEITTDLQLSEALSRAVAMLSRELNAQAIVVRSYTGHTAQMISKERPAASVLALTTCATTARRLALCWGVEPIVVSEDALAHPIELAPTLARDMMIAKPGQFLLLVSGGQTEEERNSPGLQILQA